MADTQGSTIAGDRSALPSISVIVVTYNSAHCLARALSSASVAAELIVVDNASSDTSIEVARQFPCTLVANDCNRGFGAACNQGAQIAKGELLLFLNPDAVLGADAIDKLAAAAVSDPAAVAFGPQHHLPADDVVDLEHKERLVRAKAKVAHLEPAGSNSEVGFLSGAALLCRKAAFAKVDGFDERFFLYFEDQDLCLRLARLGTLVCVGDAVVFHLPGRGARLEWRQLFTKYRQYGHSRAYFSQKHRVRSALGRAAFEQLAKGVIAIARADRNLAAQHLGRAVGYVEGRLATHRGRSMSATQSGVANSRI